VRSHEKQPTDFAARIQISVRPDNGVGGVGQINDAVAQMDTMTQQNAAMVEELAATAQSLSGHVRDVSNSMRLFWLKSGKLSVSQLDAVEFRRLHKSDANMSSFDQCAR
jgi:aerotaxis receptor